MRQQRRRRSVADPDFPDDQDVTALGGELPNDFRALFDGGDALLACHGGFGQIVACPLRRDLGVYQIAARSEIVGNAGIDYLDGHAVLAGEHVGAGASGQKILHHLPGDFLRIRRQAGFRRAMVSGKNQVVRAGESGRQRLLDTADVQGDFFEYAQRSERLGLVVDFLLQSLVERGVERGNREVHRGLWSWRQ